jgi:hypothetical protein
MCGVVIQMFIYYYYLYHSIAFNSDHIVSLIMNDACIMQPGLA